MRGLFLSEEQRRLILVRTHPAYGLAFYVLSIFLVAQLVFGVVWGKRIKEKLALDAQMADARKEESRLMARAAKLEPILRLTEEVNSRIAALTRRTWVSEVLSRIERCASDDVCLSELTIHNQLGSENALDHMEVTLSGFLRSSDLGAWPRLLQSHFPDWNITQAKSTAWVPAISPGGGGGGLVPFALVLTEKAESSERNRIR